MRAQISGLWLLIALSSLGTAFSALAASDSVAVQRRRRQPPAAEPAGPIGSMQPDELLADGIDGDDDVAHTPLISEMTRHVARWGDDIWWNNANGESLGVVQRARWRQLFRDHFVYVNEAGEKRARGVQPLLSAGVLYTTLSELYVTDMHEQLLVHMYGTPWTLANVRFEMADAQGIRIADAHVDTRKSSIVFTRPGKPAERIASLLREQATDDGFDRWRMMVLDADVIPDDAWPVLGAFFVRYQDPSMLTSMGRRIKRGFSG